MKSARSLKIMPYAVQNRSKVYGTWDGTGTESDRK